ncbi:MAG: membrane protein insertion efficiency factor YidD [Planctomycetota bacterium]|nr:membrane protein insertion efficiency factor YidD [Planctomycetota bacterium]
MGEQGGPTRLRINLLARPLILGVRLYQAALSPLFGGHCRYHPTCSEYAVEALATHGALRGSWLILRRVLRCHPLGGAGYDPVPQRRTGRGPMFIAKNMG